MSKRNQIQNAILGMNPAAFQLLGDAYFNKQKLGDMASIGSVVGKERTKPGTPDTAFISEGRFTFIEYTVQAQGSLAKMEEDLEKCLDEKKTGIPAQQIDRVIFCCGFQVGTNDINVLQEKGTSQGCVVRVVGIDTLAWDLLQKYPDIAREFLAVEVDTGQILDATAFVANYQKSGWAAPLNTEFIGREDEIESTIAVLTAADVVIISGKPGVGKSRLALECGRRFVDGFPDFELRCIHNSGLSVYEDLKAHFPAPGKYIVLVDDANRLAELKQVLDLLGNDDSGRMVKLILTVRDYAIQVIQRHLPPTLRNNVVEVGVLDRKKIDEILKKDFGIHNHLYLEQIDRIAQGNARLAVMAAVVAKEKGSLQSISDASSLYDEYFTTVMGDLAPLSEPSLMKTAGLIAFLRVVSKDSEDIFASVAGSLNIDNERFWQDVELLDQLEIVELHENEVAKLSDQVLSTYLVYKVFFKERWLDLAPVIDQLMKHARYRLTDALYPVASTFDSSVFRARLRPYVSDTWRQMERDGDEEGQLRLAHTFYFMESTKTLGLVQRHIQKLASLPRTNERFNYAPDRSRGVTDPYLELLERVGAGDPSHAAAAVTLLFDFASKQPSLLPQVMHLLTEAFSYQNDSYVLGYAVEHSVINELSRRLTGPDHEMFEEMFLGVVNHWLGFEFSTSYSKGRASIVVSNFGLVSCPELHAIRRVIWNELFNLYSQGKYQRKILEIIHSHAQSGWRNTDHKIVGQDAATVLPLLKNLFGVELDECIAGNSYLAYAKQNGVRIPAGLTSRFNSDMYQLLHVLVPGDRFGRRNRDATHAKREAERKAYFSKYKRKDFSALVLNIPALNAAVGVSESRVDYSLRNVLIDLALRDRSFFKLVVNDILKTGNFLGLNWSDLTILWVQAYFKPRYAWNYLKSANFNRRYSWMFAWYKCPSNAPSKSSLEELIQLYEEAPFAEIPREFDHVLAFQEIDSTVFARLLRILLKRVSTEGVTFDFEWFFPGYHKPVADPLELLNWDISLLKAAYRHHVSIDDHHDNNGYMLRILLALDPAFIQEYIDWMFEQNSERVRFDDQRNYSFIWTLPNYVDIMFVAVLAVHEKEKNTFTFGETYLSRFFIRHADKWPEKADERITSFLNQFIDVHHADIELMQSIFKMANYCIGDHRLELLKTFLSHDTSPEDFMQIPLEPTFWSWSGSAVPMHENRVKFLENILPLLEGLKFLQHRQRVEEKINDIKLTIERELRKDFIESVR